MAAVHAGAKRSFHQMHGFESEPTASLASSRATSREQSPFGPLSRPSSKALDQLRSNAAANSSRTQPRQATFEPSASIVLIGVRGVGKSTLGVLAATAYNRRLIDSELAFLEATGSTTTAYRKAHGSKDYQTEHNRVLSSTLKSHSTGAVIVCSFSDLEGNGSTLIREFAQDHPVIHVTRDINGIQAHLHVGTAEKIDKLLSASRPLLQSCSNYEYFNLSDTIENGQNQNAEEVLNAPSERNGTRSLNNNPLTLKRVERDFLRLLRNIIGDDERGPSHRSAYPLSQMELEERAYTFAVVINVSEIDAKSSSLEEVQTGADCIELVAHCGSREIENSTKAIAHAFAVVRRASILPILVRLEFDDGALAPSHTPPLSQLTDYCFRLGPELCAIDLRLDDQSASQLIYSKGRTKAIGERKYALRPEDGWLNKCCIKEYKRSAQLGCDLFRIAMPAEDIEDSFSIPSFQREVKELALRPRLMAYNTGPKGRFSKCFNKTLTPVISSTSLHCTENDPEAAPPRADVTAKEATQALFASFVFLPLKFYVYGANVSYSLSPAMHNAAYKACGMDYTYSTYSSDSLNAFKELVHDPSFGGSAIALPFKATVLSMLDGMSPHAKSIGAVNTVVPIRELRPDGSVPDENAIMAQRTQQGAVRGLYGFNTGKCERDTPGMETVFADCRLDWTGIRACIRRGLSPANTVRSQSSGLVCGAGGMARAAVYSMISLGVRNIFLCNRTVENAAALAEHYNKLVEGGEISELSAENAAETHIRVIDSFSVPWPKEFRQPTMIVACVPRVTPSGDAIDFSLPEGWLKSPTGGVVVEVRSLDYRSILA